jgi:ADP-heptose:LPS heptosyltransferase
VKRILVVKLADLGDLLTATPAIRALRYAHPDAHIGALITPKCIPILANTDLVDEIIPFEKAAFDSPLMAGRQVPVALGLMKRLRAGNWDALALLHHLTTPFGIAKYAALCLASGAPIVAGLDNGRGWFLNARVLDDGFGARHEADYWLAVARLLGGHNPNPHYELPVTEADRAWADAQVARLASAGDLGVTGRRPDATAGILAIHPGSGIFSLARRWPAERFAAVIRMLSASHGLRPVVIQGPGPDEAQLARTVIMAAGIGDAVGPSPTLGALVAFLSRVRLFIGNESGVMHLAVAAGTPVVAVFGPTNDRAWGPYPLNSPRHAVVREVLACSPCIHRAHSLGTPQGCTARTCLDLVEPAAVAAAAARVLAEAGGHADQPDYDSSELVGAV